MYGPLCLSLPQFCKSRSRGSPVTPPVEAVFIGTALRERKIIEYIVEEEICHCSLRTLEQTIDIFYCIKNTYEMPWERICFHLMSAALQSEGRRSSLLESQPDNEKLIVIIMKARSFLLVKVPLILRGLKSYFPTTDDNIDFWNQKEEKLIIERAFHALLTTNFVYDLRELKGGIPAEHYSWSLFTSLCELGVLNRDTFQLMNPSLELPVPMETNYQPLQTFQSTFLTKTDEHPSEEMLTKKWNEILSPDEEHWEIQPALVDELLKALDPASNTNERIVSFIFEQLSDINDKIYDAIANCGKIRDLLSRLVYYFDLWGHMISPVGGGVNYHRLFVNAYTLFMKTMLLYSVRESPANQEHMRMIMKEYNNNRPPPPDHKTPILGASSLATHFEEDEPLQSDINSFYYRYLNGYICVNNRSTFITMLLDFDKSLVAYPPWRLIQFMPSALNVFHTKITELMNSCKFLVNNCPYMFLEISLWFGSTATQSGSLKRSLGEDQSFMNELHDHFSTNISLLQAGENDAKLQVKTILFLAEALKNEPIADVFGSFAMLDTQEKDPFNNEYKISFLSMLRDSLFSGYQLDMEKSTTKLDTFSSIIERTGSQRFISFVIKELRSTINQTGSLSVYSLNAVELASCVLHTAGGREAIVEMCTHHIPLLFPQVVNRNEAHALSLFVVLSLTLSLFHSSLSTADGLVCKDTQRSMKCTLKTLFQSITNSLEKWIDREEETQIILPLFLLSNLLTFPVFVKQAPIWKLACLLKKLNHFEWIISLFDLDTVEGRTLCGLFYSTF
eukprot:TRINITY_DN5153_c0_g1_i1.p1 TRINITY_DN5153_c0_g1~~TRINITY_DN5153_c0_g1_i1.p1  ORF type:complete len:790 (-),score=132.20 TRINITY_DN5153_c0_g1_i1:290-2659(-)